ncbi:hypothetical protein L6Q96_16570 [Candidatus Binatia bacterium]|nr:hypothetical protein [Candidatus Binatia bacterium]
MTSPQPNNAQFVLGAGHPLRRLQGRALLVGVLGLGAAAAGFFLSREHFFRAYLVAYLFWFGVGLGCLGILMIHHVAGGRWSAAIRRILESGTRTLPLMAVLFLPMILGLHDLYEWARPEEVAHDPMLQAKSPYLNVPFFLIRAAIYFTVWLLLARFLNRWSIEQDARCDPKLVVRMELLSRGGLVAMFLTMTFASVDWAMSLEPHWFSTIYGVIFIGGQLLAAMAFIIQIAARLVIGGPLTDIITAKQFHDYGKLLLAFVMLWAYFNFSQLIIIWSGNLPEESPWYMKRMEGGWQYVGVAIILFHFVLPFVILLSRDIKKRAGLLAGVALFVFLMRLVDMYWLIIPAFSPKAFSLHWIDAAVVLGMGGVWVWFFVRQLQRFPLVPLHDPALALRVSQ